MKMCIIITLIALGFCRDSAEDIYPSQADCRSAADRVQEFKVHDPKLIIEVGGDNP